MVKKNYDWGNGAVLEEHTKKKHRILTEYFRQYLLIRCQHIHQRKFRLIIVDGFSGSGSYSCGAFGSPLLFVSTLIETVAVINTQRKEKNFSPIEFYCDFFFNDIDQEAVELLKKNIHVYQNSVSNLNAQLNISFVYSTKSFDNFYKIVKPKLLSLRCNNIIFNLDQCGYSHATSDILKDIISSWRSAEIVLTFMIKSLLTYLSQTHNGNVPLEPQVENNIQLLLKDGRQLLHKKEWLGEVEKIVFNHLNECAPFVSPFSISNPGGWQYWLMHFATSYRARQVFNDILHQDSETQVHFGRAGLSMLSYEPLKNEGQYYLFDDDSRTIAKDALYSDIPLIIESMNEKAMTVERFYELTYNTTPAHCDDIHKMMIANPDVTVKTDGGGARRTAHSIRKEDVLHLNVQKYFIF